MMHSTKNSDTSIQSSEDRDLSMPIGMDGDLGGEAFDPLAGASAGKKGKSSALLLGGVVVVAIAGLVSMRTLARVTAAAVGDQDVRNKVDAFVIAFTGEKSNGTTARENKLFASDDPVLERLRVSYTDMQVPLTDVQRNPFVLFNRPVAEAPVVAIPGDRTGQLRAEATRRIEQASLQLTLTSCLMGSSPLASINNKIVREGETIEIENTGIIFRIAEIRGDSTKLIGQDTRLAREMPSLDLEVPVVIRIER